MEERMVKTHLIVTDVHDEYNVKWCGRIIDTKPLFKNDKPIFVLKSSKTRVEMNTLNMESIERCARRITNPRGRAAVTTDKTNIYIKEESGKETLIGVVTHNHIKTYAPMYDRVGYR